MSNQQHVVHHPHETQAEAHTRAEEIPSNGGGGEVVTHGLDARGESETVPAAVVDWSLLSPQGHVLFYIALCPESTIKDIARAIGHSERQIWSMVKNLEDGGMLRRRKHLRRHHFTVNYDAQLLHPTIEGPSLRSLMKDAVEQVRRDTPDLCEQLQA